MDAGDWSKVKQHLDACLDLGAAQWAEYLDRACPDPQLRAEVESLLACQQEASDFLAHPVLRESFIGSRLGHWKIVGDIGEGGMSRVCLAERDDGQFQQRAAVKILKLGMDTDLILRHFQMERQILAGMRHPNIARLLDGGVTPSGRPFFVMEHIEGEPIDRYADGKVLQTVERLRLFQQICAAVSYAHQRLIVHRDIKPANILVTPEGTAKLLDFGIATIVSVEPALGTLTSAQMLTPDYASPEQIRGDPVTTSSDVYSLGVLLYRLLSGHNPYGSATTRELARAICEFDPTAPSTLADKARRRVLSGDLDNIVLKALEKHPQQRYSSVQQFSEDIDRYLGGRPVLARPPTWTYRTSKFVSRNKLSVGFAAVLAMLLTAGVATTLWQARLAAIERRRAEEQFFETRQLANSLMFELHDAIKDLPGSTSARALIIERSIKYLGRISEASRGNAALQIELAEGYKRLGDVQGRSSDANLGDYASSRTSYEKAVSLLREPARDPVLDRKRRRLLALTLIRLKGAPEILQAVEILESLRATGNKDRAADIDLATGYWAMADLMLERRDLPQALGFRLKEWTLRKQIAEADSGSAVAAGNYALASKNMGGLLWRMKREPEAMNYYQAALRIEEGLAAQDPLNADKKMAISFSHSDIGLILSGEKKFEDARRHYGIAIKIREELALADPNNARATLSLASAYWRGANVAVAAGDSRGALDLLNRAAATLAQAKSPDPASPRSRTELAQIYSVYGDSYAAAHNPAAARDWYDRSKRIFTALRDSGKLDANGAERLQDLEEELRKLRRGKADSIAHPE